MKNPYIVDHPLTDKDLFHGREESFDRLGDYLGIGQRLILLYGKPRIGKTSFLNQLPTYLGTHYLVRRLEWALIDDTADPLWRIMVGIARAMGQVEPDSDAYRPGDASYAASYLGSLFSAKSATTHLICFDALPVADFVAEKVWEQAISTLRALLDETGHLAILLAIEGCPKDIAPQDSFADLPAITLGPLREEDIEDLLTMPVRGTLTFDYEAIRQIQRLSGGEPSFAQLFGRFLFERRAKAGWVGLAEVDHVKDQVVAFGAPQFEGTWDACSPTAQIVLCAFAEMTGYHGMGSAKDVVLHVARLRIKIPAQDVENALSELSQRAILIRLGGETYRFANGLFRYWVQGNKNALDVVRQPRGYRRARPRRILPLRSRHVDWAGLILWLVAGLLALLIVFVWRSRQKEIVWTVGPTPPASGSTAVLTTPTAPLPTPETGVAPGHIVYVSKERTEDTWEIYVMRSDGSDPVQLTHNQANDTLPVLSPDGRRIAFVSDRDGNREIYVMNADGNEQLNLTAHPAEDWTPTWSPDGQHIAYASFRDGNWEIYVMDADGSNQARLTENSAADYGPSWSPDGQSIAFVSSRDGNLEIYLMDAEESSQTRFTQHEATDQSPVWSPDSTQILWETYREDNMEIYTAHVDGSELCNLSRDAYADDHGPTWSPWGRRIAFYSNRDHGWDIYTLELETGERVNLTMSPVLEQQPHWGR